MRNQKRKDVVDTRGYVTCCLETVSVHWLWSPCSSFSTFWSLLQSSLAHHSILSPSCIQCSSKTALLGVSYQFSKSNSSCVTFHSPALCLADQGFSTTCFLRMFNWWWDFVCVCVCVCVCVYGGFTQLIPGTDLCHGSEQEKNACFFASTQMLTFFLVARKLQ